LGSCNQDALHRDSTIGKLALETTVLGNRHRTRIAKKPS
jgi:hypothetical protein